MDHNVQLTINTQNGTWTITAVTQDAVIGRKIMDAVLAAIAETGSGVTGTTGAAS